MSKKASVKTPRSTAAKSIRTVRNWIRPPVKGQDPRCGLTRGQMYDLAARGLIVTSALRVKGKIKGTRLFDLTSILAYLESRIVAPVNQPPPAA